MNCFHTANKAYDSAEYKKGAASGSGLMVRTALLLPAWSATGKSRGPCSGSSAASAGGPTRTAPRARARVMSCTAARLEPLCAPENFGRPCLGDHWVKQAGVVVPDRCDLTPETLDFEAVERKYLRWVLAQVFGALRNSVRWFRGAKRPSFAHCAQLAEPVGQQQILSWNQGTQS